jgi:hypothetical protein
MSNNEVNVAVSWFKGHPWRIALIVVGVIAVGGLVLFNQQINEWLNLVGSRADTGRQIVINGNPEFGEHGFFDGDWDEQPGEACFRADASTSFRLTLNSACSQLKVSLISPNHGRVGDEVTLTGSGFVNGATVKLDNNFATNVVVTDNGDGSNDTIKFTVPEPPTGTGAPQEVTVLVTAPGGTTDNSQKFTYDPSLGALTGITVSPNIGVAGDEVTITGDPIQAPQGLGSVKFGDIVANEIVSWTEYEIKVKVPAGNTGLVRVVVINNDGVESPDDPTNEFDMFQYPS